MKRITAAVVLLAGVVLSLCVCGRKEALLENYTFGNVGYHVGADGSGYRKAIGELYEIVGGTHNIAFSAKGSMRPHTFFVWDTADGGMVACDYSTGTYVYITEDITYNSLAFKLKNHLEDNS